jgi:hypothetical protein
MHLKAETQLQDVTTTTGLIGAEVMLNPKLLPSVVGYSVAEHRRAPSTDPLGWIRVIAN